MSVNSSSLNKVRSIDAHSKINHLKLFSSQITEFVHAKGESKIHSVVFFNIVKVRLVNAKSVVFLGIGGILFAVEGFE